MEQIRNFELIIDDATLSDLKARLCATRWPDMETVQDWSQGVPLSYLRQIIDHWRDKYDFQRLSQQINRWPNFTTNVEGLDIHFMHIRSSNPNARPLIMTHGWPGSVVEFLRVIEPLTEPQKFGGKSTDAFHLVIPSLPGYGFSGQPKQAGWGVEKIGDAWAKLMQRLGYDWYLAQGGDWGSAVTYCIARQDHDHCRAIHLNLVFVPPDESATDLTDFEISALKSLKFYEDWDSGYAKQQSTRPQSLGYGLADSPTAQAAWIIEKFYAWMDCDGNPENVISRDEILDNIMVYWVSNTGASSARLYWESIDIFKEIPQVKVPMGASIFPKEIIRTSRRFAERVYTNIIYWNELNKGGHFAAFEKPQLFVEEVQNCFREIS